MNYSRIFIAAAAILIFFTISVVGFLYFQPIIKFNSHISEIEDCMRRKDAVVCSRTVVQKMLEDNSGSEIMHAFDSRLAAINCHYVGHVVGQQSYKKYKSVDEAISQCDNSCESACEHGVVGQAFAEELGFEESEFDVEHLSPEDIKSVGDRLCTSSQPCHGVGHTLFQAYRSFRPALSVCQEIASESMASFCNSGVFMEYADAMTSKTVRPISDIAYPDERTLNTFCLEGFTMQERRSCFQVLPRIAGAVTRVKNLDVTISYVAKICDTYSGFDRSACYAGIGASISYKMVQDQSGAKEICENLPRQIDSAACHLGIVGIEVQSRPEIVFRYCSKVTDPTLREMCYQGIFARLNQRGASIEDAAQKNCANDALCLSGAENSTEDIWAEIDKKFGKQAQRGQNS